MAPATHHEYYLKRKADIVLSLLGLILLSPLFLIIVLLILADSGRPVLYRQPRTGKGGIPFNILKFRTMIANADKSFLLTIGLHDNRITRTGYYLRKYKIDELPQLINVLKGEMSLVGPRPYLSEEKNAMGAEAELILSLLPGMTGLWQVSGRNEIDFSERLQIECGYVLHRSFGLDLIILLKTIPAVFRQEGAY